MEKHLIPTEYGLILSAFSHSPTLRGAAALLNMDPSGLVRKVQKMAEEFGLLQKSGNKWIITEKGLKLNRWYDESVARQKLVMNEKPVVRIASFTWLAEQYLIPNISRLNAQFSTSYTWSFKTTSSNLEQELINNRSDFVITGHPPNDPLVAHKRIFTKNWVVIVPVSWQKQVKGLEKTELDTFLQTKPFVRLASLSPAQILKFKPHKFIDVVIDGVIGVRSAVAQGLGWSCVPAMSIYELEAQKKIIKLDVQTLIKDDVSLWWLRSRKDLNPILKAVSQWLSEMQ
jgi:DNA-binding transcriptional LysR family regulator